MRTRKIALLVRMRASWCALSIYAAIVTRPHILQAKTTTKGLTLHVKSSKETTTARPPKKALQLAATLKPAVHRNTRSHANKSTIRNANLNATQDNSKGACFIHFFCLLFLTHHRLSANIPPIIRKMSQARLW